MRRSREQAAHFVTQLAERMPDGVEHHVVGSWRRSAPTIGNLDVVVVTPNGALDVGTLPVLDVQAAAWPLATYASGKMIHATQGTMDVRFMAIRPDQLATALVVTTGPAELFTALQNAAGLLGLRLTLGGLVDEQGRVKHPCTEEDVFNALSVLYMTPAERQAFAALTGEVETRIVKGRTGIYTLTIKGHRMTCSCPGFQHREKCRHVDAARAELVH